MQTLDQYSVDQPVGFAGQIADLAPKYVRSYRNGADAEFPFGVFVSPDGDGKFKAFDGLNVLGILAHSHTFDPSAISGDHAGVAKKDVADVLLSGVIRVRVENAVTANTPVFVRVAQTSPTSGEQIGACRSDDDGATAVPLHGTHFLTSAQAGGIADVYFDYRVVALATDKEQGS